MYSEVEIAEKYIAKNIRVKRGLNFKVEIPFNSILFNKRSKISESPLSHLRFILRLLKIQGLMKKLY